MRRYAVARSLGRPTTLSRAIARLGFIQADPIRAPACAQDLILRHRVIGYRTADLARRYPTLPLDEDYFVNYGYLSSAHSALLHPRTLPRAMDRTSRTRARALLRFANAREEVHPREAAAHFAHGPVANYWGGTSHATTQLLDLMHYEGLLRVRRRDRAIRVYERRVSRAPGTVDRTRQERADALVGIVVGLYAPLTASGLTALAYRLRRAAPQLDRELRTSAQNARNSLAQEKVAGLTWYWPAAEDPRALGGSQDTTIRFLAPFDPIVWDRSRFEQFWGWAYRFEAYTPVAKRRFGYYAVPLLWRDEVIGWGNLSIEAGQLVTRLGYVSGSKPRSRVFSRELDGEIERMRHFLRLESKTPRARSE